MSSSSTCTQRSALESIRMAVCPMAFTARRTKSTSTSLAYLKNHGISKGMKGFDSIYSFSSLSNASTFFSAAKRTIMSSFSTLTYEGSLYLQKNTRISFWRISCRFCSNRLMLRSATHCTSGSEDTSVTTSCVSDVTERLCPGYRPNGGAILRTSCLRRSSLFTFRIWIIMTYAHKQCFNSWD